MSRLLVLPFIIGILVIVGLLGTNYAMIEAGPHTDIDAETWTPNPGNVTELDHSNVDGAFYDSTVVVRDDNDVSMVEGEDYNWYVGNGTVEAISGGGLDGVNNAEIDYGYSVPSEEQQTYRDLLAQFPSGIGLLLPMFGVVVLIIFLRGG